MLIHSHYRLANNLNDALTANANAMKQEGGALKNGAGEVKGVQTVKEVKEKAQQEMLNKEKKAKYDKEQGEKEDAAKKEQAHKKEQSDKVGLIISTWIITSPTFHVGSSRPIHFYILRRIVMNTPLQGGAPGAPSWRGVFSFSTMLPIHPPSKLCITHDHKHVG